MADYSAFDSILDATFAIQADGKVIYCNDAAASFVQSSVRRLVGKAILWDLLEVGVEGLFPFEANSPGYASPTPITETNFKIKKDGSVGKVQVAVRPAAEGEWLIFARDVSLEEALHSKYRSELAQKEDYARNLEKLVEARTAELNQVNLTLKAILNSLGQGFFTFNATGDCGSVFTRACEIIIEGTPVQRKAWDVLRVPDYEKSQFEKWMQTSFGEVLPFDDLKALGPNLFPHTQGKYVVLDYFPIRAESNSISDIVVVATDKTVEHQAQLALEAERQYAAMVVKYLRNKDQFLAFLSSVKSAFVRLRELTAAAAMTTQDMAEAYRVLHTLEGEAGTFSLRPLREASRVCQQVMEVDRNKEQMGHETLQKFTESLNHLEEAFSKLLSDNQNIFRLPEGETTRVVELPLDRVLKFGKELDRAVAGEEVKSLFAEEFLKVPMESQLKYFDSLIQSVAEGLGKKVLPLEIRGGEIRILPESYQKFFSSLVHAFRNAVDHGLEMPDEREWAGKNAQGQIIVEVESKDSRLFIRISDDGAGIDPTVIREKLKKKFPDQDFNQMSDIEVIQQVCRPGFSSRDTVGEFSGRGVGLDALREEVVSMGGDLTLESVVGKGTTIKMWLPALEANGVWLRSA